MTVLRHNAIISFFRETGRTISETIGHAQLLKVRQCIRTILALAPVVASRVVNFYVLNHSTTCLSLGTELNRECKSRGVVGNFTLDNVLGTSSWSLSDDFIGGSS
jgi:hypothetical protein